MSKMIYLDNAATTPLLPQVKEVLKEALEVFGNPSSIHEVGVEASERLKRAREEIASVLGVNPSEVIFNSGATEGNNTVFMDLLLKRKRGNVIISPIEHKSVSKPALRLREFGIEVRVARVGKDGIVDPQSVEDLMDKDTLLVSLMSVSNEFGTVQPVEKGIGFMIARKPLAPLLLGGGQEMGMRSGTENLPAILALVEALKLTLANVNKIKGVRDTFERELAEKIPQAIVIGKHVRRSPAISAVIFPGIPGSEVVRRLSEEKVFCSSGSACVSGENVPNEHLLAMGYTREEAIGMVRFSFGLFNDEEEVSIAVERLRNIISL